VLDVERLRDLRDRRVLALECERRGPRDHPQPLHLGQDVQQLLGEAVREVVVRLVVAHVDERQHGDRGRADARRSGRHGRCRARRRRVGDAFAAGEAIEHQHADRQHQEPADHQVELARRRVRDRLAAIDEMLALQALGRQLVDPREDERRYETERKQTQHQTRGPVRKREHVGQKLGDLQDDPAGHEVEQRDTDDVAAPEL
jgi:hypothetical protein